MGIIAITGYNKPDLLYLYLEQLEKSGELDRYKVRFHTEEGYDPDEHLVICDFKKRNPHLDIQFLVREKNKNHPLVGFHNILTSYISSAYETDDFVIIGEEDMLPTKDYLRFNRECYEKFLSRYDRIFCVCHKRRPEVEKIGDPSLLMGDYQLTSPSCISVKAINRWIRPVLEIPGFFENPVEIYFKYLKCRIGPFTHTHHDGALERIMLVNNLFAIKPDQARSMHVGLSGIFCGGNPPQGTMAERVAQWRELIKDGEKLRSLSNMPQDIVVTDPEGPEWSNLELDLDRTRCRASTWFYDPNNDFKKYINE